MKIDPEGPAAEALAWVERIVASDDLESWHAMDGTLQRWFAQWWLTANPAALQDPAAEQRTRDAMVEFFVGPDGVDNALFPHLWRVVRREVIHQSFGYFAGEELMAGTFHRPVTPVIEAVRIFRAADMPVRDGVRVFDIGASAMALTLMLSHAGGRWRIASTGAWLPVLGWPPTEQDIPDSQIDPSPGSKK